MKRDAKRAGTSNAARAQRSLDTIRSVDIVNTSTSATVGASTGISTTHPSSSSSSSAGGNQNNSHSNDNHLIEKKTLRVIFDEETQLHEVEYICDTVKDCNEILEKLKFLLAKRKKN